MRYSTLSTKIQQSVRLKSIFLLSRPLNLLIVAVTMYISRYVVLVDVLEKRGNTELALNSIHFGALVLSALLITAAGNVINDYFDQRVDKINKPEKVIVGKAVSRKVAILIHQGMNLLALGLAAWVSVQASYWQLLILPLLIMFFLWWYSPVFKKKPLVGNLIVAFCTAAVPVFAVVADLHVLKDSLMAVAWQGLSLYAYAWLWIFGVAAFAFTLTMIREAIKDAQDEPGDREGQYQTIPIIWGMKRTKSYVLVWITVFFLMTGWCVTRITSTTDMLWLACCLVVPMVTALYYVLQAKKPIDFGKASRWIKIVMLGGLVLILAILA
jgi:4-hydroxybenzoate polyprenyltransferase